MVTLVFDARFTVDGEGANPRFCLLCACIRAAPVEGGGMSDKHHP
jgi:hypothetical protein